MQGFFYNDDEYIEQLLQQKRHLVYWDFGQFDEDKTDAWDKAIADPGFLTSNEEYPQVRMQELYDDTYRIVDHNSPDPMSWIGYSDQEDVVVMSGIEKYMDEYLDAGIAETFKMSYDEWMSNQYWKRKLIVSASIRHLEKKNKSEANSMATATKDMSDLLKNLK